MSLFNSPTSQATLSSIMSLTPNTYTSWQNTIVQTWNAKQFQSHSNRPQFLYSDTIARAVQCKLAPLQHQFHPQIGPTSQNISIVSSDACIARITNSTLHKAHLYPNKIHSQYIITNTEDSTNAGHHWFSLWLRVVPQTVCVEWSTLAYCVFIIRSSINLLLIHITHYCTGELYRTKRMFKQSWYLR